MEEKNKIFSIEKDGTRKEYSVILTFKNNLNEKDYIVYTDNIYDKDDKLKIYAAVYNPDTKEYIESVKNQEEWHEIIRILDKVLVDN